MADERSGSGESRKTAKSGTTTISDAVAKLTVKALQNLNLSSNDEQDTTLNVNTGDRNDEEEEDNEDNLVQGGTQLPSSFSEDQYLDDVEVDFAGSEEVDDSGMDVDGDSESDGYQDDEGEPDSDLIVLDPSHPLMKRFQKAYEEHLKKQDEKSTLELRELLQEHSTAKKQREEIGVELYGVQQELARQQMQLEKQHDDFNEKWQLRKHCEAQLNEIKTLYKQAMDDLIHRRRKANELQTEVENIAAKLLYVESAKDDVRSDISILKRAAEKAGTEVIKAQREKQKQDLLVNKLVSAVDHLRGDIAMYDAQIQAQREETKAATRTLTDATTELEAIDLEKKQLLQQWNNSLIGMKRRDESYGAMQEAVNVQKQQILAIETELDGYRKQILKAQEQNEQLTYMYNRIESDITAVKKQITVAQNKHEALKIEYSTYSRTLHETEQFLNRAQIEVTVKESELVNLRKLIEKEFQDKIKIEDLIMSQMQEQLTAEKASQYTKKMTNRIRKKSTQLERSIAEVENEISKNVLEVTHATTRVRGLQDLLSNINKVIHQKNETISKIENEIVKRNAVIEKKEGSIDQLGKKIDVLISKEGGEAYTGPLEFQIKTLQRQIESTTNECLELQQYWLRQQGELVKVVRQVAAQSTEVETKKKESTILMQKKLRIEGELNSEKNEISDIQRSVRSMQNDMTKLNLLIHKNRDKQDVLQQDNILLENDFMSTLKDAELKSIQMQNSITALNEEKERLLNALVEAERQIMLWEKKTQLAREARDTVDSDVGNGEIHAMKAEIHRMEVRYAQLMRQQEKIIQDMEKSVFKRECIIVRGEAQAKMDRKKLGKPKENKGTFHKKVKELKKKIKQTNQDSNACEDEINRLRGYQQELSGNLEEKQSNGQKLQQAIDIHESDIERMVELKQRNFNEILKKQQKAKYYTSLKGGKYTRLCKTPTSLDTEKQKQTERFQCLSTIVDRLNSEYPEMQPALREVTLSLGSMEELTERSSRHVLETA
ncbi:coiled-coil domain-containing protein 40-like [Hydractinia symbiolongicarpus]|uniref:coiled-coil domain-containing protein 40-like n=1 Tax=Hydractinia symbiolongicarpus TaxID=13093 RepID=UPI00254AB001|nr:coiled-coil domain-containing protein 40-like [Hydractinia symbiolongicarpus]